MFTFKSNQWFIEKKRRLIFIIVISQSPAEKSIKQKWYKKNIAMKHMVRTRLIQSLPCLSFEEQFIVYRFKNKALTKAQ